MNDIYGLYCICDRCEGNTVRYVGQTTRGSDVRFRFHRYDAAAENYAEKRDLPVYRWMRKHGVGNIRYTVLETVEDAESLNDAEMRWIAEMGTFTPGRSWGLNLTAGGSSLTGYRHSEETRERMRGRTYSIETREKMSQSAKARGTAHLAVYSGTFKGEKSPNARMSDDTAREVKGMLWDGFGLRETAEKFGLGLNTVAHLASGRTWAHVPWPTDRPRIASSASKRSAERRRGVPLPQETKEKMSRSISRSWDADRRARESARVSGEGNPASKVTEDQVRYIRARTAEGASYASLSDEIGVSSGCISRIARGLTWEHVV